VVDLAAAADTAPARARWFNGWTVGAVLLAGLICLPVAVLLGLAMAPEGELWRHLLATVLPGYFANMSDLLDALIDAGIVPIVFGISRRLDSAAADLWVQTYNAVARGLAQARSIPFIDLRLALEPLPGYGISGDDVTGTVDIDSNTAFGPMVFDATCGGGPASNCSGGDSDLYLPGQGGVLIISEDGDSSDPDDFGCCPPCPTGAAANDAPTFAADASDITTRCTLVLDFENFGEGLVTITDVTLVDVEEDAYVWLYRDGNLVGEVRLEEAGDGMVAQRFLPFPVEADLMVVKLNGSGAVDDIGYSETVQLVG